MNTIINFFKQDKKTQGELPFLLDELTDEFIDKNFTKASPKEVLDNKLIGMKYTGYKKINNYIFVNLNNGIYKYKN